MYKEAFESTNARIGQETDLLGISLNHASPCGPIDATLSTRRRPLLFKSAHGNGRGHAVQGHVDKHGVATGRGCLSGGFKALPVSSSRFVDMDMRIHQAGQQRGIAEVLDYGIGWNFTRRGDPEDLFSLDRKSTRLNLPRRHQSPRFVSAHLQDNSQP